MTQGLSLASSARVHATTRPADVALVDPTVRWSWADLDRRADLAAVALARAGVAPGDRVALLAEPSAAAVAVLHGIARAGAVAAPLGTRLTRAELAAAGVVLRPTLVIHDDQPVGAAEALGVPGHDLDDVLASGHDTPSADPAASGRIDRLDRFDRFDPRLPAVAILTSGTTGRPQVALLSTAALAASAAAWSTFLPPAGAWLLCLGLGHVAGLGVAWRAAAAGVPLVIVPAFEPEAVLAALQGGPAPTGVSLVPTHVSLVPTQLGRLLDAAAARHGTTSPPSRLIAVPLGGGPIPPALVIRALAAGWPVVPTYGLTEAGSGVTALSTAEAAAYPGSAGRALHGVELRIADPEADGVGEIRVRTAALFDGYLDDPAATAAALAPGGWLRTGDLGRLDGEGRLFVVDRRTDLIVSGGENVAPAEVEAVLLEHPAVAGAGVVGRLDAEWGSVPVAVVVLRPGIPDPGDEALRVHCRERLAAYKVPAAFLRVDSLPRTASGKLRRAELRATVAPVGRGRSDRPAASATGAGGGAETGSR